jgi:hypothetical protein
MLLFDPSIAGVEASIRDVISVVAEFMVCAALLGLKQAYVTSHGIAHLSGGGVLL